MMQQLSDRLRMLAEHLNEEDAHLLMLASNHMEAMRVWKIRWAETEEKLHNLHQMHEKLLREHNEYRREHGD